MRLLVTGSTGFIGSNVLAQCLDRKFAVATADRSVDVRRSVGSEFESYAVGDIGPNTDWKHAVRGRDVVIHVAGRAHVLRENAVSPEEEFRRVNLLGAVKLAESCVAAGVRRLVFISSAGVGGSVSDRVAIHERDPPNPQSLYARIKLEAENRLKEIHSRERLEFVIVRPPLVYGPGAPGNFHKLLNAISRGVPLPLASVRNRRSLVGVDNLADLILLCATSPAASGQTFYATDGVTSTPDLVRTLAQGLGRTALLFPFPVSALRLGARLMRRQHMFEQLCTSLVFDSSSASNILGWQPAKPMRQGLIEAAVLGLAGNNDGS